MLNLFWLWLELQAVRMHRARLENLVAITKLETQLRKGTLKALPPARTLSLPRLQPKDDRKVL